MEPQLQNTAVDNNSKIALIKIWNGEYGENTEAKQALLNPGLMRTFLWCNLQFNLLLFQGNDGDKSNIN